MATLIQIRRDTEANWTSNNPVLASGELALSTDQDKIKVGDGASAWSILSYINALPAEITAEISAAIDSVIDAAPGTLDTLNELAAAINDDASFYTTITNSISSSIDALDTDDIEEGVANLYFTDARALSATSAAYDAAGSAATAEANANTYTDGEISTLDASLKTYADTAESDAVATANAYTDGRETAITTAYQSYADQAEADAITSSNTYTDGEISTLDTSLKAYADTAESDSVTTANAYTDTRETAITTAYQAYADTAESDAVSTANAYTDARETAITTAYQSYADTAEADAISAAATDATSKADTAESNAKSYTDDLVGDITVDGTLGNTVTDRIATAVANLVDSAPGTLDTLNELAAALGDDPNFATSIATTISDGDSSTLASAQSYADGLASNYDPAGSASTAESNANTYTDNAINALDTDAIEEGSSNLYFTSTRAQDATPGRVVASLTKPSSPSNGDGWLDTDNGILYIYMSDADSSQWVEV